MLQNEAGNVEKEDAGAGNYSYKGFDILSTLATAADNLSGIPSQIGKIIKDNLGLGAMFSAASDLDKKSADLVKTLGSGFQRSVELQRTLTLSIPQFVAMGLKADEASSTYESLIKKFNINLKLSDDQLVKLAATAKVTGVGADELARTFRDVGFSIDAVGDSMLDVTKIANQAGVTVASVAGAVSKNLEKLNLYNFDNGVKGLAKMAAQASRLGVDMEKVFSKSEELLSPEKAIDFAASLQRLGVTSSELLDPLRAMDLAQNDPVELQNQIVNLSKDFVRFNEQNNQFEILPGAKRRMREVANELGLSAGEFSKMAINAASFDEKLKKIKFSPEVSEDDRELVATMAQFNKGGVAQVRVTKFDSTGKPTGESELVDVNKLTADNIQSLKAEQALQGKTMEEIAVEQLSEAAKTNAILDERLTAYRYGMAQSELVKPLYSKTLEYTREASSFLPEDPDFYTKGVTKTIDLVSEKINEGLSKLGISTSSIYEEITSYATSISGSFESLKNKVVEIYESFVGETTTPASTSMITSPSASLNTTTVGGGGTETASTNTQPTNMNITHTFNFSNLPSYVTSTEVERILKEYTQNAQNALAMVTKAGKINAGLTTT